MKSLLRAEALGFERVEVLPPPDEWFELMMVTWVRFEEIGTAVAVMLLRTWTGCCCCESVK